MARDHYIPAAFIGGFSSQPLQPRRRKRPVWVMHRGATRPYETTADRIGYVDDLYHLLTGPNNREVDDTWSAYEQRLIPALEQLVDPTRPMDANTWLRILVPFVTGLFVRGPDFNQRYEGREGYSELQAAGVMNPDNTNMSRLIELQRLLAPVTAARWVVQHRRSGNPYISNDLGLARTMDPDTGDRGWAIPLSPDAVLSILIPERREVVIATTNGWKALIEHRAAPADGDQLNRAMAQAAQRYVFGPTEAVVRRAAAGFTGAPPEPEYFMERWPFDSRTRIAHEFDWHRLASIVGKPVDQGVDLQAIDFEILGADWCPMMMLPANLPDFSSGLVAHPPTIELELGARTGFPGDPDYVGPPGPDAAQRSPGG